MGVSRTAGELTERDREILRDIVRMFVLSNEPVSSRALSKMARHDLSSASIRNVMADLEEDGFLSQPHSSAGRIPTPSGYHLYIDSLMQERELSDDARDYIDQSLNESAADPEKLVNSAGQLLSELTEQIGVIVTPAIGDTILEALTFMPLSGSRVLCVLVSSTGFVDNKVIETEETYSREELVRLSNCLTDEFGGLSLRAIRERLVKRMAEERAEMDGLLNRAIHLATEAVSPRGTPELVVEGTSKVLTRPELASVDLVRRLLDTFTEKAKLVGMLNQLMEGNGVRVVIGEDSDLTSELDFSLVARNYGVRDRVLGSVAIFGPSRMPYEEIIPLVDYFGDRLTQALDTTFNERTHREDD